MAALAGLISGLGGLVGAGTSLLGNSAQKKATKQAQAAQEKAQQQQMMLAQQARDRNIPLLNDANQQALGYISPYQQTGQQANTALAQQMGLIPDASGNIRNPLTQNFNAQDYQNSVGYTPLTSNQLSREQYGQMQGVAPLVDNNIGMDAYKQSVNYTPMVNSLEDLQKTPGYQFQLEQGLQGIDRTAAARGGLLSGATLKAANNYAQGQAATGFQSAWERAQNAYQNFVNNKNTQFNQGQQGLAAERDYTSNVYNQGQNAAQQAYNNFTNNQNNTFNKLFSMGASGQNAAQSMANQNYANAGNVANQNTNYANTAAGISQNYADNTGNLALRQGANNANTYTAIGNQLGSSLTDIAGKYLSNNTKLGGGGVAP